MAFFPGYLQGGNNLTLPPLQSFCYSNNVSFFPAEIVLPFLCIQRFFRHCLRGFLPSLRRCPLLFFQQRSFSRMRQFRAAFQKNQASLCQYCAHPFRKLRILPRSPVAKHTCTRARRPSSKALSHLAPPPMTVFKDHSRFCLSSKMPLSRGTFDPS